MRNLAKILASGFGTGYAPVAPGTVGSILMTFILYGIIKFELLSYTHFQLLLILLAILLFALGVWASNEVESIWGKDPSKVVIDEMLGIVVAFICIPMEHVYLIISLILFRVFDIWKPLGIRKMEDYKGGVGVMADDLLAGIYANIALQIIIILQGQLS